MLVREFYDQIWWPRCEKQLRECTRDGYICAWKNWIEPAMGDFELSSITPRFLDRWLVEEQITPGVWRITRAFIRTAYKYELLEHDPTKRVLNAPTKRRPSPSTLSRNQMTELMDGLADTPIYPVIVCSCTMGLRREEACALLWEDFDWKAGTLSVSKGVQFIHGREVEVQPKTDLSNRVLPLPPETVHRLKHLAGSGRITGEYHVLQVANLYRKITKERELPYVPLRNLRTSWCTMLINEGVPVSKVSRYMGHADVETTMRWYTKPRKDELREVAEAWTDTPQVVPHKSQTTTTRRPKVYVDAPRKSSKLRRLLSH